tara:strand:+ start:8083 stop:8904 length:822 start_codon:yes stop_codon:yes gene_type:complete
MNLIFTLVVYKNKLKEILPLLNSINSLNKSNKDFNKIILSILCNSQEKDLEEYIKKEIDQNIIFIFHQSKKNNGFGKGHNQAFWNVHNCFNVNKNDLLIVVNPDISFNNLEIIKMVNYFKKPENKNIVCMSPLIMNNDQLQFSAKKDPTILSLIIGRLPFLEKLSFLQKYIYLNQNRGLISHTIFKSTYLSGCFLLVRIDKFKLINGFDERYFLHFEDADLSRELAKVGDCIHYPYAKIYHEWNRGSHKSIKQTFLLIQSMFKYFYKWGLKII